MPWTDFDAYFRSRSNRRTAESRPRPSREGAAQEPCALEGAHQSARSDPVTDRIRRVADSQAAPHSLRANAAVAVPLSPRCGSPNGIRFGRDSADRTPRPGVRRLPHNELGAFATPERNLVFDIIDFDETIPAPWEWDVKRLTVSIEVAGRSAALDPGIGARCSSGGSFLPRAYGQVCGNAVARGVVSANRFPGTPR